jgi:hypothetical protein
MQVPHDQQNSSAPASRRDILQPHTPDPKCHQTTLNTNKECTCASCPPRGLLSLSNSAVGCYRDKHTRQSRASSKSICDLSIGPSRQKQAQGCSLQVHMVAGCGVGPGVVGPWSGQRGVRTGPDQARRGWGWGGDHLPSTLLTSESIIFLEGGREKLIQKG